MTGPRLPGPVDGELFLCLTHGVYHLVSLRQRRGKRLFQQDVQPVGRHLRDPLGVGCRRGAKHCRRGSGCFDTLLVIRIEQLIRQTKPFCYGHHLTTICMAYTDDFRIGVFLYQAQKIPHVHVIKIYADNAMLSHSQFLLLFSSSCKSF
jgi:hypothetical protein